MGGQNIKEMVLDFRSLRNYANRDFVATCWLALVSLVLLSLMIVFNNFSSRVDQIREMTLVHGSNVHDVTVENLNLRLRALDRMADRFVSSGSHNFAEWQRDAENYYYDYGGLLVLKWVSEDLKEQWTFPPSELNPENESLYDSEEILTVLKNQSVPDKIGVFSEVFPGLRNGLGLLSAHSAGRFRKKALGYIVGVYRGEDLFQRFFSRIYNLEVFVGGKTLATVETLTGSKVSTEFMAQIGGRDFTFKVTMTEQAYWSFLNPWKYLLQFSFLVSLSVFLVGTVSLLVLTQKKLFAGLVQSERLQEDMFCVLDQVKESEAHLIESERLARIGSWSYHTESRQMVWSEQLYKIFNFDSAYNEPPMEEFAKLIHPDDCEKWDKLFTSASEKTQISHFRAIDMVSGEIIWVESRTKAVLDQFGKVELIKGTYQDITEKKMMEMELQKQVLYSAKNAKLAAVGELAAGVGHEVNNPLMIIRGLSDLLRKQVEKEGKLSEAKIEKFCSRIDGAVRRIGNITDGLVRFARKEAVEISHINIQDVITETTELIRELFSAKAIEVDVQILCDLKDIYIFANESQLQQVLVNLLNNAVDATKGQPDRIVQLKVSVESQVLELKVSDNGSGMSSEVKERIFDPFYTTKGVNEGTGLGLAIVESTIKEFGGKIEVQSELGQGTSFYLFIPLSHPEQSAPPEKKVA